MPDTTIFESKEAEQYKLLKKLNVHSVGIGLKMRNSILTGERAIICSVSEKMATHRLSIKDNIPPFINGHHTDVQVKMPFRMLEINEAAFPNEPVNPTGHHRLSIPAEHKQLCRPIPGGVSFGRSGVTGTFGAWVRHNLPGEPNALGMLTNWHIAVGDTGKVGDIATQPGAFDIEGAVKPEHTVGRLATFQPIVFEDSGIPIPSDCKAAAIYKGLGNALARLVGSRTRLLPYRLPPSTLTEVNTIDAAVVTPTDDKLFCAGILGIGEINPGAIRRITVSDIGKSITRAGRTTGVTVGEIAQVSVTIRVSYGNRTATFEDQIMGKIECAGGDSGSLGLWSASIIPFGLLFAGNDQGDTVFNQIQNVMAALDITKFL